MNFKSSMLKIFLKLVFDYHLTIAPNAGGPIGHSLDQPDLLSLLVEPVSTHIESRVCTHRPSLEMICTTCDDIQ